MTQNDNNQEQNVDRRMFLKFVGLGGLVLVGGTTFRSIQAGVFSSGKGPAYLPWETWESLEDPLPLVGAAILASNAHNSQPWLFGVGEQSIDVFRDPARNIGAIDPFFREQVISLGCAIGNIIVAAHGRGYDPQVTLLPDVSNPDHMARIRLEAGGSGLDDLYQVIDKRHTDRFAYDTTRQVGDDQLVLLEQELALCPDVRINWTTTQIEKDRLGEMIVRATESIIADEEQSRDTYSWYQKSWQDIQENRHGITLDTSGLSPAIRGVAKMLPPVTQEQNDSGWLTGTADRQVPTTSAWGTISVRDAFDDRQRLQAGMAWQLIHLRGTVLGLGMQPVNQVVERIDRDVQLGNPVEYDLHAALNLGAEWQPVFQFRLGYPTQVALPGPRRPVEDVLL